MLMHFSCMCTFVSIYYYIELFGAYLYVSFSPSLFLALVCSMAPKRKSTPSWNPLRFGASSSDSTPSYVRFCDEKAKSDFSENISRQGIHSEHQVSLLDFSDIDISTVIPVTCPSVIIQEFYSNMTDLTTLYLILSLAFKVCAS